MAGERGRAVYRIDAEDRASRNLRSVTRRFDELGSATRVIQGPLDSVSGRITSLGAGLLRVGPAALGVGLTLAGLVKIVSGSVREFNSYERQMLRVENVIKTTGAAAGFTAGEIESMALRLGIATLTSASQAREAAGILLSFERVAGGVFERTLELSQDLAEVMGLDLRTTTLQLAKALSDPAKGLDRLRRAGVTFTDAERDMIKEMLEAGRVLDAQREILAKVEKQVGGAGEGAAGGLSGAIDSLTESWAVLGQTIGKSGVGDLATELIQDQVDLVTWLGRSLGLMTNQIEELKTATTIENERAMAVERLAHAQQQLSDAREMDLPLGPRLLEVSEAGRNLQRVIGSDIQRRSFDRMLDDYNALLDARKADAEAQVQENFQMDQQKDLLDSFDKELQKVRKSLGSTTLKQEEQLRTLDLLRLAYDLNAISLREFIELQERLTESQSKGIEVDSLSRFVAPRQSSFSLTSGFAGQTTPVATEPNVEEKKQTNFLQRIERHLADGTSVAVTV